MAGRLLRKFCSRSTTVVHGSKAALLSLTRSLLVTGQGQNHVAAKEEQQQQRHGEVFLPPPDWSMDQLAGWEILKKLAHRFNPSAPLGSQDFLTAQEYTGSKLVFTGREKEMRRVEDAAQASLFFYEDHPCFVALQGGSGSGKSRMLRECPHRLRHVHNGEGAIASLLLDFNGGGDSPEYIYDDVLKGNGLTGAHFMGLSVLFRSFLGCGLPEACMALCKEEIQQLRHINFKQAIRMALWSHRTRHRFSHEQLVLFFLLVDESQLVVPSLAPAMGDAQEDVFVRDMFGAIYQYKKSYAKTDNCALLPICAGTLIPDLDRHRGFGVTSWGKLTVSLSGLGPESAIQLLEQSLDREYGGLLKSKPMLEILHHVLYLPRFLQDIHRGLSVKNHLREYIDAGEYKHVTTVLRELLEESVSTRYGNHRLSVGEEWLFIVAACLTEIPVPVEEVHVYCARLKGYIYPEMVSNTHCILRMPFILLQMFRAHLGIRRLLSWYPEDPKGFTLEDYVDEIIWKRMEVFLKLGVKELRLGDLLCGAEGPTDVLNIMVPLPLDPRVEKDTKQFFDKTGSLNSAAKQISRKLFRTKAGTRAVDHRMYVSEEVSIIFQVKGVKSGISVLNGEDSLYSVCEAAKLDRKDRRSWVMVFVLSGPIRQKDGDMERFRARFPRVLFLHGKGLQKFLPTVIIDLYKREPKEK